MDTKKKRILVVDDEISHCKMLEAVLTAEGYIISTALNGKEAVEMSEQDFYDLVLMDIRMRKMDGIEALKIIKKTSPEIPVIMMTAYASLKTAVEALKTGAYDYLTKPLNTDELLLLIEKTLHHTQITEENKMLKERLREQFLYPDIIGNCPAIKKIFDVINHVAPTDATVLILGKSGTGKELIANAVHENSLRKSQPFVKINCAALPETLLESELFGHIKGSFTGADKNKKGKFSLANKGTIFLDEIAEMTPATQVKLLRVLQEKEFDPIGSSKPEQVDIRIIAATNKVPEEEIAKGNFREDLFYRLNVVSLTLPPLNERNGDIRSLADHFLEKYAIKNQRTVMGFTAEAYSILQNHNWPGNVRELENVIERAIILSNEEFITAKALPESLKPLECLKYQEKKGQKIKTIKDMEKEMILMTLEENNGNRTHAAEILGISRRTLQLKLKEYSSDN